MEKLNQEFQHLGLKLPRIILPVAGTDMEKWSVIACDQYTSEPEYWEKVATITGGNPTTLKLIFPETYLDTKKENKILKQIKTTMDSYLEAGVLVEHQPGLIYTERSTEWVDSRKGLVIAVDLEQYDYHPGAKTLIRASEETIVNRLPPRIKIRENAQLELPHIILLIDDPDRSVIESLADKTALMDKVYDTDLMLGGGHIRGYRIQKKEILESILNSLKRIADPQRFKKRYNSDDVLLFAVGDGNHSLATAKEVWNRIKSEDNLDENSVHPARYALVEIINIYDKGLRIEPIHRTVFNVDVEDLLDHLPTKTSCSLEEVKEGEKLGEIMEKKEGETVFAFSHRNGQGLVHCEGGLLPAAVLQDFLDEYLQQKSGARIDYIHGWDSAMDFSQKEGNISFFMPPFDQSLLFPTIIRKGVLPRKTFSLGEAPEKRYYMEARRIE